MEIVSATDSGQNVLLFDTFYVFVRWKACTLLCARIALMRGIDTVLENVLIFCASARTKYDNSNWCFNLCCGSAAMVRAAVVTIHVLLLLFVHVLTQNKSDAQHYS